jgi:hypothetical protein
VRLYHYTCSHAAPLIIQQRWLHANPHPLMPEVGPLIHLTDLDSPDRHGLGLTSYTLRCDRTEFRVTVVTSEAIHWPVFARTIPRHVREELESAPGALPMHWYVSRGLVPVLAVVETAGAR